MDANAGNMVVPGANTPNDYAAKLQKKFEETANSSPHYAQFRARKAAYEAKKRSAEGEAAQPRGAVSASPATTGSGSDGHKVLGATKNVTQTEVARSLKAVSASPAAISGSDSDGLDVSLPAWKPRKQRLEKEPVEGSSSVGNAPAFSDESPSAASTAGVPFRGAHGASRSADRVAPIASLSGAKETSRRPSSANVAVKNEDAEKPARQAKRPTEPSHDDVRSKAAKKTREPSATSASESPAPLPRRTGTDREPPTWYKQLPKPKGERARNQSDAEISILRLKASINRVKAARDSSQAMDKEVGEIAERLHALILLPVDGKLLRQMRILDNKDGLPQLFDKAFANDIDWPWWLKADAEELYNKWCTGEFETDLYRGIERSFANKKGKGKGKADSSSADSLMKGHERFKLMDPKQHGNGLLLNGAWWPSQLTALRDGGHGATQGGITSNPKEGAYSVIMAGGEDPSGQPYPNEDNGSEVLYCGTDNKNPDVNKPSLDTEALLTNYRTKQPVRLFRSHNLDSKFAPELGFRYDGLYDVVSYEDMDPPENKRRRHRFKLVRRAGQDPIRSEGPAKRPTKQEIDEFEKDKKNRGR